MKKIITYSLILIFSISAYAADGQSWLLKARQGNLNAMYQTAMRYYFGTDGLPKNIEKARYWAEKGAEGGNLKCMEFAGETYDDIKTAKFDSKRLYWHAKAGEAGSFDGAFQARSDMLRIEYACDNDVDKKRAVEGQIYWNEKMLANPTIYQDQAAYQQSMQLRESLKNQLDDYTPKTQASPRTIVKPAVNKINANTSLDKVILTPEATILEMSFVNVNGIRQWNINRDAYITCDITQLQRYPLVSTKGVYISPKPTNISGNKNERISFTLVFEPIPLNASSLFLTEGPTVDNFHIYGADITE